MHSTIYKRQLKQLSKVVMEKVITYLYGKSNRTCWQKYKMLQSILPVNIVSCSESDEFSVIDRIETIIMLSLVNCCDSVVPFN